MAKKTSKTIKRLKKLVKSIKKDNKKFRAAAAAKKRVLIAKDVLASLRGRKVKPACGVWLTTTKSGEAAARDLEIYGEEYNAEPLITGADIREGRQLSEVLKKIPNCRACAIGSMFNASIQRFNKLKCIELHEFKGKTPSKILEVYSDEEKLGELNLTTSIRDADAFKFLGRFFGSTQLREIEMAFELGFGRTQLEGYSPDKKAWGAVLFGMKYRTARSRMKAIMENIVKNKGFFIPASEVKVDLHDNDQLEKLWDRRDEFVESKGVESNDSR